MWGTISAVPWYVAGVGCWLLSAEVEMPIETLLWTKIVVAAVCGAILGVERQLEGKPLGIRSGLLVCVATAAFVHAGADVGTISPGADPTRVVGQVITGVGFLGAGAVMQHEGSVQGMTTAATVWLTAAVGVLVGVGLPWDALLLSVVAVVVLRLLLALELRVPALQRGSHADLAASERDRSSP